MLEGLPPNNAAFIMRLRCDEATAVAVADIIMESSDPAETAASAFEALVCLITLQRQVIPPTINLREIDPECDLCHVPLTAREATVAVAISNSFGFGGSNSCAIFRRV